MEESKTKGSLVNFDQPCSPIAGDTGDIAFYPSIFLIWKVHIWRWMISGALTFSLCLP